MAVESTVAIVEAAAMMPIVTVIGDSKHAIYGPNRTADAGTDRAAYHGAHRARRTAALARALLRSANDSLRMSELRDRQQCNSDCRRRKVKFRRPTGRQSCCLDLDDLHLDSLYLIGAAGLFNAEATEKLRSCWDSRRDERAASAKNNPAHRIAPPPPCLRPPGH
jgi:hypothetical protein